MKGSDNPIQQPRVLVINPGSTSTKVALFRGYDPAISLSLDHNAQELSVSGKVMGQLAMREKAIRDFIDANAIREIDAVAGRGGLLRPLAGGTYHVNDRMCRDLEDAAYGEHASNLGPILARSFGRMFGVPAFIVDPVTIDEYEQASRITGVPGIERKCRVHALNMRSVARRCAQETGKELKDARFVIAHLGGGVSVCALMGGKIIDSTDALLGEGPFSMERAGTLPLAGVIDLCFERGLSKNEVITLLSKESGFKGYLGIDRLTEVLDRIQGGDEQAVLIFDAMVRQVAKWIGGMIALSKGRADCVILTGGMVHSRYLTDALCSYIEPMAQIRIYPGEFEMEALAEGVIQVLGEPGAVLEY